MSIQVLLAFWGLSAVLIVVPGPDWAFTLASGVRDRVVLPAVAGLMVGYAAITVLVSAGLGALVAQSPVVLTVLTVAGAAYLSWLGAGLLARPGSAGAAPSPTASAAAASAQASTVSAASSAWMPVVRGAGVSGLNPKGLLLFLALLPQFTDPDHGWPEPVQLATLGLLFVGTCGLFYTALGLCARTVLRARPTAARTVSRISGGAMVVIGIGLLAERLLGA